MEWNYRPERQASWDDIAESIHDSVTIESALNFYLPSLQIKGKRCPCPIHNGKDYNFSFSDRYYKCFVCGASGDVISLVKDVCELSTRIDAMKKINSDFRISLPIGGAISEGQNAALARRRAEAKRKQEEQDAWWDKYHKLMDEYCALDKFLMEANPDNSELAGELAQAQERLKQVEYELDCLPPEPR